ncbi:MAG: NUDIX hydrolase [Bacillota bacterium]
MSEERSAGGIVFCGEQALVLRNFRGEYVFPKGHIEAGESQLQAALREVAEESGLTPQVVCFLQDTCYRYRRPDGTWCPKRVSWYLMEVRERDIVVDNQEINWGAFLPPEKALELLSHQLDRELLLTAIQLRVAAGQGKADA